VVTFVLKVDWSEECWHIFKGIKLSFWFYCQFIFICDKFNNSYSYLCRKVEDYQRDNGVVVIRVLLRHWKFQNDILFVGLSFRKIYLVWQ
jgi:hypothetical protein